MTDVIQTITMIDSTKLSSLLLYCAQKETHIFNVAISNELFDWNTPHIA